MKAMKLAQEMFRDSSLPEKKQLLNIYLNKVTVYPEHVEIVFNHAPQNLLPNASQSQIRPVEDDEPCDVHKLILSAKIKEVPPSESKVTCFPVVEGRCEPCQPIPEENDAEIDNLDGFDMAWLPIISVDSKDVIDEIVYVGKATMKKNSKQRKGENMQTAIMVAVNGNMLLFNNILSEQEYRSLQSLADSFLSRESVDSSDIPNVKSRFVDIAKTDLNICLKPIAISYVIRIK